MKARTNSNKEPNFINIIHISSNGKVYNTKTKKIIKCTDRGYFYVNTTAYNIFKLMLFIYKNEPIKNGYIQFKNNNQKDWSLENIEYRTKLKPTSKPKPEQITKALKFYFYEAAANLKDTYNFRSQLYRIYLLKNINQQLLEENSISLEIAKLYLNPCYPSVRNISQQLDTSISDVQYQVNNLLNLLTKLR